MGVTRKHPYPWIRTVTGYQGLIVSSRKHLLLNTHFHSFSLRLFRPLETLFIYLMLDAPGSVMSFDHASGVYILSRCFVTQSNYCCMHAASDTYQYSSSIRLRFRPCPDSFGSSFVLSPIIFPFFTAIRRPTFCTTSRFGSCITSRWPIVVSASDSRMNDLQTRKYRQHSVDCAQPWSLSHAAIDEHQSPPHPDSEHGCDVEESALIMDVDDLLRPWPSTMWSYTWSEKRINVQIPREYECHAQDTGH